MASPYRQLLFNIVLYYCQAFFQKKSRHDKKGFEKS